MFDWNDYLTLAIELAERDEESCKRAAISRAYYAAFGCSREYLENKGLSYTARDNVHFAVWNMFTKIPREGSKIAIIGDRFKKRRHKSDYDKNVKDLNSLSKRAIKEAKEIRDLLEKLN